jgi:hypothetical protein
MCHRCSSSNIECVYSVSMVGKVQGIRRRRKHSFDERADSGCDQQSSYQSRLRDKSHPTSNAASISHFHEVSPTEGSSGNADVDLPQTTLQTLSSSIQQDQLELNWPTTPFSENDAYLFSGTDNFLQPFVENLPSKQQQQQHPRRHSREASVISRQQNTSSFGDHPMQSLCLPETSWSETGSIKSSGTVTESQASQADCQSLLACVRILQQLWQRQEATHVLPDVIMGTNKAAVGSLTEFLSELEDCQNRDSGVMLCVLAMQAIADLYNQVFESSMQSAEDGNCNTSRRSSAVAALPAFGFGSFEIDTNSQRTLFNQVILKEIEIALKLWKNIWTTISNESIDGKLRKGICENSFLEIRNKLRKIVSDIDL